MKVVVKEFARLTFQNLPVKEKDVDSMKVHPKIQKGFNEYLEGIKKMSDTEFHEPYSDLDVLNSYGNFEKLARLTRNEAL